MRLFKQCKKYADYLVVAVQDGNYIKKYAGTHPAVSRKMIDIGLHLEQFRTEHFAEKTMPKAYQKLNTLGVKNTLHALEYPESTVWCNLFAPVEIFQCFGLSALSMECLSSFLSGFTCEDYFIDRAESRGIASTLCSYHKDFIGAVDSGIISPARLGVTTSMICDGNINTFRYVSRHTDLDTYVIDVPDSCSPEAVEYVTMQLKELIQKLEALTGKRLSMDDLSETLARENQSKAYYKEFLKLQAERYYPSTLTLQMYMLFATHLNIGTPETLDLFRSFAEDIKQFVLIHRIFNKQIVAVVHLVPVDILESKEAIVLVHDTPKRLEIITGGRIIFRCFLTTEKKEETEGKEKRFHKS